MESSSRNALANPNPVIAAQNFAIAPLREPAIYEEYVPTTTTRCDAQKRKK